MRHKIWINRRVRRLIDLGVIKENDVKISKQKSAISRRTLPSTRDGGAFSPHNFVEYNVSLGVWLPFILDEPLESEFIIYEIDARYSTLSSIHFRHIVHQKTKIHKINFRFCDCAVTLGSHWTRNYVFAYIYSTPFNVTERSHRRFSAFSESSTRWRCAIGQWILIIDGINWKCMTMFVWGWGLFTINIQIVFPVGIQL